MINLLARKSKNETFLVIFKLFSIIFLMPRLECKILSFQTIPESAFCTISPAPRFLFETSFLFFFLIPMTIMIFLYLRMGLRIRKTTSFGKNTAVHGESKQVQSKRAILKMLGKLKKHLQNCAFWHFGSLRNIKKNRL